ncbi:MAG: Nif3-like dinuclear metal center hexameric protein [Phycisphaerae bacterium]|jgi:dinuclear metal center YbgI/SA1388 family protein|nr:Nif3-like dinuclear metal center hexameric protein [Phycisphaerae bacterium]
MATVRDILNAVDAIAPLRLAEDWDNVGLLLGNPDRRVRKALVCMDVTSVVIAEAKALGAGCIISHHPFTRDAFRRVTTDTFDGRIAVEMLEAKIALVSAHTNLDAAAGGLCDHLADIVGLTDAEPLSPSPSETRYKLAVFVPDADLAKVQAALFAAGAGHIGAYRECSFRAGGVGTFRAGPGAKPAVGRRGRREEVCEYRLEVVVPTGALEEVIKAMRAAHSYEEPAFDVYPTEVLPEGIGISRHGLLAKKITVRRLAEIFKRGVKAQAAQVSPTGMLSRTVQHVAVCSGSAGSEVVPAIAAGCEVLLCGELKHHDILTATAAGMATVMAGHFETEKAGLGRFAKALRRIVPKIEFRESRREGPAFVTI